jgi:hypothetical protein
VAKALDPAISAALKQQAEQAILDHRGTFLDSVPVRPETLLALLRSHEQRQDLLQDIHAIDDVRVGQHNHILAIPREITKKALAKIASLPDIEFEEISPSL